MCVLPGAKGKELLRFNYQTEELSIRLLDADNDASDSRLQNNFRAYLLCSTCLPGILHALDHLIFKQPYDVGSSLIGTGEKGYSTGCLNNRLNL